ncbi:hypothetical protein KBC75_05090 [Candidatus Shapirobacteria bacterium]|nr:hypothetical protein [Candidatus Shapirobacteria bacterium]
MSKKSKTLILVSIIILLLTVITYVLTAKKSNAPDISLPSKVVIPTREPEPTWFSDTGATYISPTDKEYTEQSLIANLRNKCPLETEVFVVSYNYSIDKFQFILKDKKNGQSQLDNWFLATGYDQIPKEFIEVK